MPNIMGLKNQKHNNPGVLMPVRFRIINKVDTIELYDNKNFKLVFIKNGNAVCNLNDRRLLIQSPSLICLTFNDNLIIEKSNQLYAEAIYFDPRYIHEDFTIESLKLKKSRSNLDYYLIEAFNSPKNKKSYYLQVGPNTTEKLSKLFLSLNQEIQKVKNNNICVCWERSYIIEILTHISRLFYNQVTNLETELTADENNQLNIEDILLFLYNNYTENISIKILVKKFATNRTTLQDKFKKITGYSIKNFLNNLRIKKATTLLADSNLQISEICYRVGFNDISNFYRTFKKVLGFSPKNFKKQFVE